MFGVHSRRGSDDLLLEIKHAKLGTTNQSAVIIIILAINHGSFQFSLTSHWLNGAASAARGDPLVKRRSGLRMARTAIPDQALICSLECLQLIASTSVLLVIRWGSFRSRFAHDFSIFREVPTNHAPCDSGSEIDPPPSVHAIHHGSTPVALAPTSLIIAASATKRPSGLP